MTDRNIPQENMTCHFDEFGNRAKQPVSAFMMFASDIKPKLLMEYPNIKTEELGTKLSEEWFKLPEEEKMIYHSRAQELTYIHNAKCQDYRHPGATKSERDLKRKSEESFKHMVEQYYFLQNSGLRLLDSPFIHKSKRSRYDLPYTYRPAPDAPRNNVPKRIPSSKGYRRSYPTYKERIQMMERGIFPRQIQTNLGVFKRSEENPNVLIRDDSTDRSKEKPRHPMSTKSSDAMLGFSSYYPSMISSTLPRSNVPNNNSLQPRLIGNTSQYCQVQMPAPTPIYGHYNFSQHDPRGQYRIEQQKFIQHPSCSGPPQRYHDHPTSFYQQTITVPSTVPSYVGINSTNHVDIRGSGSITVKYEPAYQMQYTNDFNTNDYLNQDSNYLNQNNDYLSQDNVHPLNFNDNHHYISETSLGHVSNEDEDLSTKDDMEFRDDLDTINPTITVTEGIEQYLPQDGQPYVMIPVDLTVARKLGWPVHMLPTMPNWLSKLSDNFHQESGNIDDASVCSTPSIDNIQEDLREPNIEDDEYKVFEKLHAETMDAIENLQREMDIFETVEDVQDMVGLEDHCLSGEKLQNKEQCPGYDFDIQKCGDIYSQINDKKGCDIQSESDNVYNDDRKSNIFPSVKNKEDDIVTEESEVSQSGKDLRGSQSEDSEVSQDGKNLRGCQSEDSKDGQDLGDSQSGDSEINQDGENLRDCESGDSEVSQDGKGLRGCQSEDSEVSQDSKDLRDCQSGDSEVSQDGKGLRDYPSEDSEVSQDSKDLRDCHSGDSEVSQDSKDLRDCQSGDSEVSQDGKGLRDYPSEDSEVSQDSKDLRDCQSEDSEVSQDSKDQRDCQSGNSEVSQDDKGLRDYQSEDNKVSQDGKNLRDSPSEDNEVSQDGKDQRDCQSGDSEISQDGKNLTGCQSAANQTDFKVVVANSAAEQYDNACSEALKMDTNIEYEIESNDA